jgi:hypothetical protein
VIPAEEQTWFAGIRWEVLDGFTGGFEVQRATRPTSGQTPQWGAIEASIPAPAAVGGVIEFEQQIPVFSVFCYRVRTVINGETGPFSEAVCMERPPSSGGIGPATQVPLPPDVGNAAPRHGRGSWWVLLAGVLALALGVGGIASTLASRRLVRPR